MSELRPLAVVGATASGKSAVAHALARARGDTEIISVDSMQVYRGMDVGTAKPTPRQQAEVRYHLIDLVEPSADFDVARFAAEARAALADITRRGRRPLLVGGTGLYHRAVIDGLELPGRYPQVRAELEADPDTVSLHQRLAEIDPVGAGRIDPANRRRVVRALEVCLGSGRRFSSYGPGLDHYPPAAVDQVGIWMPRTESRRRIAERFARQMDEGFLAEVDRLAAAARPISRTAAQALGYRELLAHRRGDSTLDEAVERAITRTRQFARRQRVWFRRDPRIRWVMADPDPEALGALVDGVAAVTDAGDRYGP